MSTLRSLTAAEEAKPYAKYYREPVAEPRPELLRKASVDVPLDPSDALLPQDVDALLDPDSSKARSGWCILPNGAGYMALDYQLPGLSVDMVEWWSGWHGIEDLRYMIWHPPSHYGARVSDEDLAKVLDPSLAAAEKFQGVTHFVIEDVGAGGPCEIAISFLTPEQLGFDLTRFRADGVRMTAVGGQILMRTPGAPEDAPSRPLIMLHLVREVPGGVEYRSRFWFGYAFVDGTPVCVVPEGTVVPDHLPIGCLKHNIEEFSNLRVLLPQLYEELGGTYA